MRKTSKKWTQSDVELLHELYPKETMKTLEELFKTDTTSIQAKAKALGIRRTDRKTWNQEDIEKLKSLYAKTDTKEIAKILDRKPSSVTVMANKLKLKKDYRSISEENLQFLIENYPSMENKDLVEKLGLCEAIILDIIKPYGLKKDKYWTKEQEDFLCDNYSDENINYICNILKKSINSIRWKANLLGIYREKTWDSEMDKYLIDNYSKNIPREELAIKLGVTLPSLYSRASGLNLKSGHFWTNEDDELLKQIYNDLSKEELEVKFNRSYDSIKIRAHLFNMERAYEIKTEYNGFVFDSIQELECFKFIESNGLPIVKNRKKFITPNKEDSNFIPDFMIGDDIIVEYYGLFKEDSQYDVIINYIEKTKLKNEYYNALEDYEFIAIYPEDLKNNFKGVYDKIKHLIEKEEKK